MKTMTDLDKAQTILAASNDGQDLPIHQQYIVMAAQTGELGPATGLVFDDLWEQTQAEIIDKAGA